MELPQSHLRAPVELGLTGAQRTELLSRVAVGRALLTGSRPFPTGLHEADFPVLTRREWGYNQHYIDRALRIAQALTSLNVSDAPDQPDRYTLRGDRESVESIGSFLAVSLIDEGVPGSAIFAGDTATHPDVGIYSQVMDACARVPQATVSPETLPA